MASEIVWADLALSDLEQVIAYIAEDSVERAVAFADEVDRKAQTLISMPESGSPVADLDVPDLREVFVGKYRLIYRTAGERIIIAGFVHAARDLPGLWDAEQRPST